VGLVTITPARSPAFGVVIVAEADLLIRMIASDVLTTAGFDDLPFPSNVTNEK
jgi:hypothetical protein